MTANPAAPSPAVSASVSASAGAELARERLWAAVRDADEYAAVRAAFDAVDAGLDTEALLLDVVAPLQARIGAEWAAARITVAQEHAATAIQERVLAALAHRRAPRRPDARAPRVTVVCVDGEWHALPARLLAEVLRGRGWAVDYLGAHVPTPHLIAHLHRTGPGLVALSCSFAPHLPLAHAAVTACQAAGVPVITGGAAFGPDGRYARAFGADGWAAQARQAAVVAQGVRRPDPLTLRETVDDLPHLADQEYTLVAGTRQQLVRDTLTQLADLFPPVRAYTDRQRDRTAEDLAHVVDHLATALYVDDADLFRGFLEWTAVVLTARGVPARALDPALDLLGRQLQDFPRAGRILRLGRETLGHVDEAPHEGGPGETV
ncbi:cobalamin-dependent protein [Streptomyces sp. NPDC047000]|uniref:cobalamin B12-binding domain-containing protein n=1 Tax=Streptomyces sp. NPDC047000 TaxID=3155474 RepID=UPI0033CE788D